MPEIRERVLCTNCKKDMVEAHIVLKKVPYTEGTATCCWCRKKRYCTSYLVQVGEGEQDAEDKAAGKA